MADNIGIDLGTTNSVIANYTENGIEVLESLDGGLTVPSVVSILKGGDVVEVGKKAKKRLIEGSADTVGSFKVEMGSGKKYRLAGKEFTPIELSAEVLRYLRRSAEKKLGRKVEEAVITVPAYFTELQRAATIQAGELAGLKVRRIINEPTAAALAYGLKDDKPRNIVVYDLGGGTFDSSLLSIEPGVIDVIAVRGDNALGGDNFDRDMADTLFKALEKLQGYVPANPLAEPVMREIAKEMKEKLSFEDQVTDDFARLAKVDPSFKKLSNPFVMTRSVFEKIISENIRRTVKLLKDTIEIDAKMKLTDIDEILLVGGSTRIPWVAKLLAEQTGITVLQNEIDPDLSIAVGAAIQSSIAADPKSSEKMVLLDVTPFDLSIEIDGNFMSTLIKANSNIPTKKTRIFTTTVDNQTSVVFKVYQGNKAIASGNEYLGEFSLDKIKPAKAKTPQFEVMFELNINGELTVSAMDIATGKSASITRKIR